MSSSSGTASPTPLIRSDSELREFINVMACDPHATYLRLSAMTQGDLALLAMQLLSKSAAPVVGPAASSRVGVGSSAATMRLTSAGRSMLSEANDSMMVLQGASETPLGESLQQRIHQLQRARPREPSAVRLLSPSPALLGSISMASRATGVDSLDDPDTVRKMSTHELEETLQVRHSFHTKLIPLQDIYFYQDYICNQFMDSRFISTTIQQLQDGEVSPETLPRMDCLYHKGRWYGMGNRRLACFHYVYRHQPKRMIPVRALVVPDHQPLYPQGTGTSVKLGGGHLLEGKLMFTMWHCAHW